MALIEKNDAVRTKGLAPKVAYPAVALLAVGVALLVLDQLGVIDVEDELYAGIIGSALAALGIGYGSPPALQEDKSLTPGAPPEGGATTSKATW